jgi:hypothetical protein
MSEEKYIKPMMPMPMPMPKPTMPIQQPLPPKHIPQVPPPMPAPPPPMMPQVMPTMISPCDLLMMVRPVVKHGCYELPRCGPKHTLTEVAMIAFLMGTGLDFRTAHMLVESWEVHETFFRDDL